MSAFEDWYREVEGMEVEELQATSDVLIEMFDRQASALRSRHRPSSSGQEGEGPTLERHGTISSEQYQAWGIEEMGKRGKVSQQASLGPVVAHGGDSGGKRAPLFAAGPLPHATREGEEAGGIESETREELILSRRHARGTLVQHLRSSLVKGELKRAIRQWEGRALISAFSLECERSELELYDERRRLDAAKAINVGLRRLASHSGGNIAQLEMGIDAAAALASSLHGELVLTQGELVEARLSLKEMDLVKDEVGELQVRSGLHNAYLMPI